MKMKKMKRIKHNDLTHYFLADHKDLPAAYVRSCEKFFRELKNPGVITAFQEAKAASTKRQASSTKPQASSLTDPGSGDINRIIKEK